MNTTYKDTKDTRNADAWFAANGISTKAIYVGTTEVFQAQKLATNTLRDRFSLLDQKQAGTLYNFLKKTSSRKKRETITQAQCFKVMNIAKQIQRKHAQVIKMRRLPKVYL
jgi:hypothetical protein